MVRTDAGAAAATRRNDGQIDAGRDPSGLNVLAAEALGGEPGAIRTFLQAVAPTIRRTCGGVMGRAHADLEDTIQEALVDTMRALPRYRFEGDVAHYVTKIALRLAIDARRRGAVRSGRLHELEQHHAGGAAGESDGRRLEQADLVRQVFQDLRPALAEALVLHLVLGFSVEEVASITQTRPNTVRKRLRVGRASIKRKLVQLDQVASARKGGK